MKIAFYLKHFPASGLPLVGGTAVAVGGLVKSLANLKQDVIVLCEGQTETDHKTADGCRILSFQQSSTHNPFGIANGLQKYLELSRDRPDLLIVNGCFHPSLFAVARTATKMGIPYVAACHTHYNPAFFQRRPYLKWPYWYLIEKQYLRGARAIQLVDLRHAGYLRELGVYNTYLAVPNTLSSTELSPEINLGHRASETINLVFRGRIDPYHKGLDLLLLAVARLKDTYAMRITIQGPDFGKDKLVKLTQRLCISSIVSFVEPDYSSPYAFLSKHDVFCLPSRFEGFPSAVLEAMLAKRVVLVTRSAGIAPHVKESGCGVLVEPTTDSIVNGLCELISRKAHWPEMGSKGQRYVMDTLSWEQIAGKALSDYESLI
jgi:glycosyltransferase involved in cell wall biosynthesis